MDFKKILDSYLKEENDGNEKVVEDDKKTFSNIKTEISPVDYQRYRYSVDCYYENPLRIKGL